MHRSHFSFRSDVAALTIDDATPHSAAILEATGILRGAFNCAPFRDDDQMVLSIHINRKFVAAVPTPNSGGCYCTNCVRPVTFRIPPHALRDAYRVGQKNEVRIFVDHHSGLSEDRPDFGKRDNYACFSSFYLTVQYDVNLPELERIEPSSGPISGETSLLIYGKGFMNDVPMYCRFGETVVPAKFVSPQIASCTSPPRKGHEKMVVSFFTDLGLSNKTSDVSFNYTYYDDPVIDNVEPNRIDASNPSAVAVSGEFPFSDRYTCMYSSREHVVITIGVWLNGFVICQTPEWDRSADVMLSISLNDQQYSNELHFTFVKRRVSLSMTQIVLAVASLGAIGITGVIVAVVVSKNRSLHTQEEISDRNMVVECSELEMGPMIGHGKFAEVYKAVWLGTEVAVKKLMPSDINDEFVDSFEKEVLLMRALRAPNILQFLGIVFEPPNICIITEFMPLGSLYSVLHNSEFEIKWDTILNVLLDITRGMVYLHSCEPAVLHRDLKSNNVLVDDHLRAKVCDFGLSTVVSPGVTETCGTPSWAAPEVLTNGMFSKKSDVYSFGIVMWECLTRELPYPNLPETQIIVAVAYNGLRPSVPVWTPYEYSTLMSECWDANPSSRPEFDAILARLEAMYAYRWTGAPGEQLSDDEDISYNSLGGSSDAFPTAEGHNLFLTSPLLNNPAN